MRTLSLFVALVALLPLLFSASALADVSSRSPDAYTPPLKDLAAEAGFKIGICLDRKSVV